MAKDRLSMKEDNDFRREMSMPQWNFQRSVSSMRILTSSASIKAYGRKRC